MEIRLWGLKFEIPDLGFRVQDLWLGFMVRVKGLEFMIYDLGFRAQGLGFRV